MNYLFKGEVGIWLNAKRQLLVMELGYVGAITWELFKKKFDDRYFPIIVKQQRSKDSTNLVQGNMIVEQ